MDRKTFKKGAPLLPGLLLVLAVQVAGCAATLQNISADYQGGQHPGTGVVFFSLTNSLIFPGMHLGSAVCENFDSLTILIGPAGGAGGEMAPISWEKGAAGPLAPRGRLVAVEIAAGEYRFFRWRGFYESGFRDYLLRGRLEYSFSVAPGKATYLGNLHAHFAKPGDQLPDCGPQVGVKITDMAARDLPLFRRNFPNFAPDALVNWMEKNSQEGAKPPGSGEPVVEIRANNKY